MPRLELPFLAGLSVAPIEVLGLVLPRQFEHRMLIEHRRLRFDPVDACARLAVRNAAHAVAESACDRAKYRFCVGERNAADNQDVALRCHDAALLPVVVFFSVNLRPRFPSCQIMEFAISIGLTYGTRAQAADASCDDCRSWLVQPRGGRDEYLAARAFEQHGCARAND